MEYNSLKEKEVIIDIESGEASSGSGGKWGKKSLNRLVGGIMSFNGSVDDEPRAKSDGHSGGSVDETTALLEDKSRGGEQSQPLVEKERRKSGKVKKAPKPPRPPKGPSLDAADMRLLKEISKIAIKKRERMERMKASRKNKAARSTSASASSTSSSLSSCGATASAMFITVFFFLVLIFQGLGSSTTSNVVFSGAPQPAPYTTGMTPVQFYKTVMSDDGAAPSFLPPRSTG